MAKLSPQGPFRALDANGDPLAGGLLYTYEAGTSTPKDTYTDTNEGTANANPVVLDSDGYADVWLGDGAYKFVLKDSGDVTLWTLDDIVGDSGGISTETISSTDTVASTDNGKLFICTAALTLNLLTASSAGDGFVFYVRNDSAGNVTLDPNAAELIDGAATLVLGAGETATIICNGSAWYSLGLTVIQDGDVTLAKIQDIADYKILGNVSGGAAAPAELSFLDEDDLTSDSDTAIPTQQSVKAYVDALVTGKLLQEVTTTDSAVATGTTQIPYDDTIPQNTEGDEYMTQAITPTNSASILQVDVVFQYSSTGAASITTLALFKDSDAGAIAAIGNVNSTATSPHILTLRYTMTAGTTSAITFKVRAGAATSETLTFNGASGARRYGGVSASSITVKEYEV